MLFRWLAIDGSVFVKRLRGISRSFQTHVNMMTISLGKLNT